jgi:hypothetical protein
MIAEDADHLADLMHGAETKPASAKQSIFYAFLQGDGGCDYTMGCNLKLVNLKGATTWEDAEKKAAKLYEDYSEYCSQITILEVNEERDFDVDAYKNKLKAERDMAKAIEEEKKAREQYNKLKERFEKEPLKPLPKKGKTDDWKPIGKG